MHAIFDRCDSLNEQIKLNYLNNLQCGCFIVPNLNTISKLSPMSSINALLGLCSCLSLCLYVQINEMKRAMHLTR